MSLGACDYIVKPFDVPQVEAAVELGGLDGG